MEKASERCLFAYGGQSDIIGSEQKDERNVVEIEKKLFDSISMIFGARRSLVLQTKGFIHSFALFLYYTSTLILSTISKSSIKQTVGEEYCDLAQINSSLIKRLVLVTLICAIPKNNATDIIDQINLALFYMGGHYYTWKKRLLGIKTVSLRKLPNEMIPRFDILGVLIGIRLLIALFLYLRSFNIESEPSSANTKAIHHSQQKSIKCSLCLEFINNSALTPCGHIFCWTCIAQWASNKPQCPICRSTLSPPALIRVHNYP